MSHQQELLAKYLRKQCSREELLQLFRYLQEDSEADYQEVMDTIWAELTAHQPLEKATSEAMYARIRAQRAHPSSSTPAPLRRLSHPWLRVAAALAVVLIGGWLLYRAVDDVRVVHQTQYGQTATVTLPDRSVVTLNGNTRISYAQDAWEDHRERELWLEGEAYFSVRHTAHDQTFVVHADQLAIEVLGTEFNVNHRAGNTQVTLSTGQIKLNGTEDGRLVNNLIMRPGEHAELTDDRTLELTTVNPERYTSWKNKELIFDHTPLAEVARLIETTYGLEVIIRNDEIKERKLTGLLPAEDLDTLLDMLSKIFDLRVTRQHNQVLIDKN